ncbi:hypothetical protein PLICRDRAFT_177272, partial [Plicaturopsis crispa FD-325 SS-3]
MTTPTRAASRIPIAEPTHPPQTPPHLVACPATPRPHPRSRRASARTGIPSDGAGSQRPPDARARRSRQLAPHGGSQQRLATRVPVSAARRKDMAPAHNDTTQAPNARRISSGRQDARARKNGIEPHHTDDEDAEDEADFEEEIDKRTRGRRGKTGAEPVKPRGSGKGKGKQRVEDTNLRGADMDQDHNMEGGELKDINMYFAGAADDDDDDEEDEDEDWEKTPGPFSNAAKQACIELGRQFNAKAKALAQQFKKRKRDV